MGLEGIPFFLQMVDSFSDLLADTSALAKSVLLILLVLSVVSWTIIFEKIRYFRRLSSHSKRFMKAFDGGQAIEALVESARELPESPEGKLVSSFFSHARNGRPGDVSFVDKLLDSSITVIVSEWESYLIFLATTATVSPFLGLLGTVWGIMSSFLSMGVQGSADLYVVGPGIAEALITTIFGLGAAIPAVVGYNYLLRVIRRNEDALVEFSARFHGRILGE